MMPRWSLTAALLAAAIVTVLSSTAQAREYKLGALVLSSPWSRATPGGAKVGAGFVTIENKGGQPDRLIAGASPIAGKIEIHEMSVEKGVMRMRLLPKGLEIPAGGKVELKPGGYHIMFIDLRRPIVKGQAVKATLTFEKAGRIEIELDVEAIGSSAPGSHKGSHH
ncbi:MAG: copper chaperone PCu(A)C [Hyphomicrobiaceae bacterium]